MNVQFFKRMTQRLFKSGAVHHESPIASNPLHSNFKGLSSLDIGEGDCVVLILPECPELTYSFNAVAEVKGIVRLISPALFKAEELSDFLIKTRAKAIITDFKRAKICRQILAILDRDIELIIVNGIYPGTHYFYDIISREIVPIQKNKDLEQSLESIPTAAEPCSTL